MSQLFNGKPQMDNYASGGAGTLSTPDGGPNSLGGTSRGILVNNPPGSGPTSFVNNADGFPVPSARQIRLRAERRARVLRRAAAAAYAALAG